MSRVPALVSRASVPPSASIRSRMPRRPLPSTCSAAAAIVLNFDPAISVDRRQPQMTIAGAGVADHVGDGFPHHQGDHALLRGRQANLRGLRLYSHAGRFQRSLGLL